MKRSGIAILIIGLIITIFTGFSFITREKVVDIGELEIMADKKHSMSWSPLIGVAVMAVGAGVYVVGMKRQ